VGVVLGDLPNPMKPEDIVGGGLEVGALLEDTEEPSTDLF
jgi:hypothetical protein